MKKAVAIALVVVGYFALVRIAPFFASGPKLGSAAPAVNLRPARATAPLDGRSPPATLYLFWATWCPSCMAELSEVEALHKEFASKGLIAAGICGQSKESDVERAIAGKSLSFPVLLDDGSAFKAFDVQVLPTLVLVDSKRTVAWVSIGRAGVPKLRREVLKLLGH